jgi:hypothetical protein
MACGGIILLHDYYPERPEHPMLRGVAQAVEDFEKAIGKHICKTPIDDFRNIALIKGPDAEAGHPSASA